MCDRVLGKYQAKTGHDQIASVALQLNGFAPGIPRFASHGLVWTFTLTSFL